MFKIKLYLTVLDSPALKVYLEGMDLMVELNI